MNIGIISARLGGTDGVSLETDKWITVLKRMGHSIFLCTGEVLTSMPECTVLPEAALFYGENVYISEQSFNNEKADAGKLEGRIERLSDIIEKKLGSFITDKKIDLIIIENAMAVPMHIPLGAAIGRLIDRLDIRAIAHHHDFYWERERFANNNVQAYLDSYFPSDLGGIVNIVINSPAKESLLEKKGLDSYIAPNVFDFRNTEINVIDDYNRHIRQSLGIDDKSYFFLQPSRIIPRKCIERSIEIVSMLDHLNIKFVIGGYSGDEGHEYLEKLVRLAGEKKVDMILAGDRIKRAREEVNGTKYYTMWDLYSSADFVTFPSEYEGWGNPVVETFFFKRPLFVNNYMIYEKDIAPLGFENVLIDGEVTEGAAKKLENILSERSIYNDIVEKNFKIGSENLSFENLEMILKLSLNLTRQSRNQIDD
ncbi:MAG: glycosyltransferase family 4 protein [Desulfobacterales bacterium]|nr:glycosyltransferase family 4 protein [Desulfobacterales bacterium]